MSFLDPYSQPQLDLSRSAAKRYAALSAIAESKANTAASVARTHGSVWRRVRALIVRPA